jgi:hypothetical protein
MQRGAEGSEAKGHGGWRECESGTAARGENLFFKEGLPRSCPGKIRPTRT